MSGNGVKTRLEIRSLEKGEKKSPVSDPGGRRRGDDVGAEEVHGRPAGRVRPEPCDSEDLGTQRVSHSSLRSRPRAVASALALRESALRATAGGDASSADSRLDRSSTPWSTALHQSPRCFVALGRRTASPTNAWIPRSALGSLPGWEKGASTVNFQLWSGLAITVCQEKRSHPTRDLERRDEHPESGDPQDSTHLSS